MTPKPLTPAELIRANELVDRHARWLNALAKFRVAEQRCIKPAAMLSPSEIAMLDPSPAASASRMAERIELSILCARCLKHWEAAVAERAEDLRFVEFTEALGTHEAPASMQ